MFWSLQLAGWFVYGVSRTILWYPFYASLQDALLLHAFDTLLGFSCSILMWRLYRRLNAASLNIVFFLLFSLLVSIVSCAFWYGATIQFVRLTGLIRLSQGPSFRIFAFGVFERCFTLLTWSALYAGIRYWRSLQLQKEQTLRAEHLAQEAQLRLLRYQLNPHFLFNSLNSINALIREDPVRADDMITKLSEFLRYSLLNANGEQIRLRDEMTALKNYFDIEKIRFEDGLEVTFDIDEAAGERKIPAFLLHPLIENGVKYGMRTSTLPLRISVQAALNGSQFVLSVTNSGHWMDAAAESDAVRQGIGLGLNNVRERLEKLYPDRHRFSISKGADNVKVTIVLD